MLRTQKPSVLWLALTAALALAASEQVSAQATGDEAGAAVDDRGAVRTLGSVDVVTSTHKIQSIQKIPFAISSIDAGTLEATNLSDVTQIQYLVPGVSFSSDVASRSGGAQIRGIGTQSFNYATEQTVGMVVDDVIMALPRDPGVSGFNDIERVEVLRGPQGTLFGKNASAGVIYIVTRSPEIGENSGDLRLSMGSRNEHVAQLTGNIAVSDTSALRLSGYLQEQDGAIPNVFHSSWRAGDRRYNGVRGRYLWAPSDRLSVQLSAEHQNTHTRQPFLIHSLGSGSAAALAYAAGFAGFDAVGGDNLRSYAGKDWHAWTRSSGASAKVDYTLDNDATLTSVTAFRSVRMTQIQDTDMSPANYIDNSETYTDSRQFSQEFRLVGQARDGRLDYTLGAFLMRSQTDADEAKYGALSYDPAARPSALYQMQGQNFRIRNRNYALFGSASHAITDTLSLIFGARYTYDDISGATSQKNRVSELDGLPVFPVSSIVPAAATVQKGNVSGKLGLQYEQNDQVMYYATLSQGYKGPAVDILSATANRIKPETSLNYELGAKTRWFDRRLTLNGSLYWDDFRDFQATTFDMESQKLFLSNAPRMRTRGVELESSWQATDSLTLSLNAAITDARFRSYIGGCPAQPSSVACFVENGVSLADLSGQRPAWYSRYTYAFTTAYQRPLGTGYLLDVNGTWSWRSAAYSTVGQAQTMTGAYGLLGGNIGIGPQDGSWRVSVYARNLLDKRFRTYMTNYIVGSGTFQMVSPDAFRTVGLSFDWHF